MDDPDDPSTMQLIRTKSTLPYAILNLVSTHYRFGHYEQALDVRGSMALTLQRVIRADRFTLMFVFSVRPSMKQCAWLRRGTTKSAWRSL
jgi:hypothetical protein